MALQTIEKLKAYFFEHAYPTWQQFHDVLDSFRHKNEKVQISDVDGLPDVLNGKSATSTVNDLAEIVAGKEQAGVAASLVRDEASERQQADDALQTAIDQKANAADVYTKTEIDNKVATVYTAKGSVATRAALPATGNKIGDVYNLLDSGMNVAYTGNEPDPWDDLGSTVPLATSNNDGLLKKEDFRKIQSIPNVADTLPTVTVSPSFGADATAEFLAGSCNAYGIIKLFIPVVPFDGNSLICSVRFGREFDIIPAVCVSAANFAALYANTNMCVTPTTAGFEINGAQGLSQTGEYLFSYIVSPTFQTVSATIPEVSREDFNTHKNDTIVHITAVERTKWNAAAAVQGTSFILVKGDDTAANNAAALQAAYTSAKTKMPYGSALSATNRYTILIGAGTYTFGSTFTIDTQYVDIVSATGNPDVIINGVAIATNDVYIKGINCNTSVFVINVTNTVKLKVENCVALGAKSFNFSAGGTTLYGTFINCTGGEYSFGSSNTAAGTFINCTGAGFAFGGDRGTASGTFTNCVGGINSFGGNQGTASGIFTNCTGGDSAFGGGGTASGTFLYCKGGTYSFGGGYYGGTASGSFRYCVGGLNSFGGGLSGTTVSGTFTHCVAGNYSFGGAGGTASGTFTHCVGGANSFGLISSGIFTNCVGGDYSFCIASGTFTNCVGGDYSFGYTRTISGTLTNCKGGINSFGFGMQAALTGIFISCTGNAGSFGSVTPGALKSTALLFNCYLSSGSYIQANNYATDATGLIAGSKTVILPVAYPSIASGALVSSSDGNIPAGTTIVAITFGTTTTTITLSAAATGTSNGAVTLTLTTATGKIRNCLDGTQTILNLN